MKRPDHPAVEKYIHRVNRQFQTIRDILANSEQRKQLLRGEFEIQTENKPSFKMHLQAAIMALFWGSSLRLQELRTINNFSCSALEHKALVSVSSTNKNLYMRVRNNFTQGGLKRVFGDYFYNDRFLVTRYMANCGFHMIQDPIFDIASHVFQERIGTDTVGAVMAPLLPKSCRNFEYAGMALQHAPELRYFANFSTSTKTKGMARYVQLRLMPSYGIITEAFTRYITQFEFENNKHLNFKDPNRHPLMLLVADEVMARQIVRNLQTNYRYFQNKGNAGIGHDFTYFTNILKCNYGTMTSYYVTCNNPDHGAFGLFRIGRNMKFYTPGAFLRTVTCSILTQGVGGGALMNDYVEEMYGMSVPTFRGTVAAILRKIGALNADTDKSHMYKKIGVDNSFLSYLPMLFRFAFENKTEYHEISKEDWTRGMSRRIDTLCHPTSSRVIEGLDQWKADKE